MHRVFDPTGEYEFDYKNYQIIPAGYSVQMLSDVPSKSAYATCI